MPEIITEKIQARHQFTTPEMLALAERLTGALQEQGAIESEFDSIKADFKSRLARNEAEQQSAAQKLRDKFEMRETLAVVCLDHPSPGRKSYFRALTDETRDGGLSCGEFIRDEPMTYQDQQRNLPLEEAPAPPTSEEMPEPNLDPEANDEPAAEPQSMDVPPADSAFVTEGFSQEGDYAWNPSALEWENVATPGVVAAAYSRLARPIVMFPPPDSAPVDPNAGTTSLADKLHKAAAGVHLAPVKVKIDSEYTADKARAQFRKAAKKTGWPEAAIDLIDDVCMAATEPGDDEGSIKRVMEILSAHTVS